MLKDMDFYCLLGNKKKSMHIGLDSLKTTFKKVVLKTIEFLGWWVKRW